VDNHTRKELKARAAQALGQGWQGIPVSPQVVLDLVRGHTEPPAPSAVEQALAQARRDLLARDLRVRDLETAVKRAHAQGAAAGHLAASQEVQRLRLEVAALTRSNHSLELDLKSRTNPGGRAREVGVPV
jgi:hypothetical protein